MLVAKNSSPLLRLSIAFFAGVLLTALSSCRLQNKTEFTQTVIVPADDISGFYETKIDAVEYCVKKTAVASPTCSTYTAAATPTISSKIPPLFAQVFTNPVALILQDRTTGASGLYSYNGGSGLPTRAQGGSSGGTLDYAALYQPSVVWHDSVCLSQLLFEQDGQYTRYANHNKLVNNIPIYGSMGIVAQVTETFYGRDMSTDCAPTLAALKACYLDPNQCGGSVTENPQYFAQVHSIFDPYISAGVMTAGDITSVEQLIYAVQYLAP